MYAQTDLGVRYLHMRMDLYHTFNIDGEITVNLWKKKTRFNRKLIN